MKICHFSTVHSIWDTRVFQRECVSLAKKHQVTLIAIGEKSGLIKGVKKPNFFFKRFTLTAFHVFKEALFTDADIYHIHDAEMIPYGIVLALNGKQVVYDIHENTYHDILLKPWVKPWIKKIAALAYNVLLRVAKHFLYFIVVVASPRFLLRRKSAVSFKTLPTSSNWLLTAFLTGLLYRVINFFILA
jgi:hypothetical protein